MPFITTLIPHHETAFLLPVLSDAEEGEERIRVLAVVSSAYIVPAILGSYVAGFIAH